MRGGSWLFSSKAKHRIDAGSAPRRDIDGKQSNEGQQNRNGAESYGVSCANTKEQAAHQPGKKERRRQAEYDAGDRQAHSLKHHEFKDLALRSAQGHADPDFTSPL